MSDDYPIPDMDNTEDELKAEIAKLEATLTHYEHEAVKDSEENARLQAALEELLQAIGEGHVYQAGLNDGRKSLEPEIAKLWAALEEIVRNGDQGIHVPGPYDIAKEALANGSTGFTWCEVVHVSDTEGTRGHGFMALVPNSALAKEKK